MTRIAHGGLYRNNGDGTFDDIAADVGAEVNGMSWGVVFDDLDNDADLDLFIVSTEAFDGTPTLLYRNDGGQFSEVGSAANASIPSQGPGLASGDFDNDGLVDLVVASNDGENRLLRNTTTGAGNWVEVALHATSTNSSAIGSRMELVAGGRMSVRTVSGGNSFASQTSLRMHVGLGAANEIDTLRVYWPDGLSEELTDLTPNRVYQLSQGFSTANQSLPSVPVTTRDLLIYPNPFSSSTMLEYHVAQPGHARIEVLDILGRRIATLKDAYHGAGDHSVLFSADNLPAAPYLFRWTGERTSFIRLGVLVR